MAVIKAACRRSLFFGVSSHLKLLFVVNFICFLLKFTFETLPL